MKRSSTVVLVLSGALFTGCDSADSSSGRWTDAPTYTNNTYVAGRGYYHAPYHGWFAYPYNYYDSTRGYYHGGRYTTAPHVSALTASKPTIDNPKSGRTTLSHFTTSSSRSSSSSPSISRGGFTSGHSGTSST